MRGRSSDSMAGPNIIYSVFCFYFSVRYHAETCCVASLLVAVDGRHENELIIIAVWAPYFCFTFQGI